MYDSIAKIPQLIRDRIYWSIHDQSTDSLISQYALSVQKSARLDAIKKDVLRGATPLSSVSEVVGKELSLDNIVAQSCAAALISDYFCFFEDFLKGYGDAVQALGINKEQVAASVRQKLTSKVALYDFLTEEFSDIDIDSLSQEFIDSFIALLFERAKGEVAKDSIESKVRVLCTQYGIEDEVISDIVDTIEELAANSTLDLNWVWYYGDLAQHILTSPAPLYDQAFVDYLRNTWGDESAAYQLREYRLLTAYAQLNTQLQTWLSSPGLDQQLQTMRDEYGLPVKQFLVRLVLGEIPPSNVSSVIRTEADMELESSVRLGSALSALLPPSQITEQAPVVAQNIAPAAASAVPTDDVLREPSLPPVSSAQPAIQYDSIIDRVLADSHFEVGNAALVPKIRSILLTRIRNIRDAIETRELIAEAFQQAGQSVDVAAVALLVKEATQYSNQLSSGSIPDFAIIKPEAPVSVPVEPVQPTPTISQTSTPQTSNETTPSVASPITKKPTIAGRSRTKSHLAFGVSGRTSTPEKPQTQPSAQTAKPRLVIEDVEGVPMLMEKHDTGGLPVVAPRGPRMNRVTPPTRPSTNTPTFVRPNQTREIPIKQGGQSSPYRIPISDVKVAPRLMDPVDELRFFTLRDFRRLSSDPSMAAKRIYQKIKLLEKDSASKKVAGIAAWKESEVAALYTQIGQESFGAGKSIKDVIATRTAQGKPTLSEAEFDALMELNEMIRF